MRDPKDTGKTRWVIGSLLGLVVIFGVGFGWTYRELKDIRQQQTQTELKLRSDLEKITRALSANQHDSVKASTSILWDAVDRLKTDTSSVEKDIKALRQDISGLHGMRSSINLLDTQQKEQDRVIKSVQVEVGYLRLRSK